MISGTLYLLAGFIWAFGSGLRLANEEPVWSIVYALVALLFFGVGLAHIL